MHDTYCQNGGEIKTIGCHPADLTVSKMPGTSNRIEIHFAVFNHISLLFLYETRCNFVIMFNKENYKSILNLGTK